MKSILKKTLFSLMFFCLLFLCVSVTNVKAAETSSSESTGETYDLVTDASTLAVDDQVIIVAITKDCAMSTTQNNNNRGQVAITRSNSNKSITLATDHTVQVLTLKAGTKTGTFAFYTGSGYLYAASSSNNHLKTKNTLDDNGSFTISITDAGVATVIAQGDNTRNLLKYNESSSLFACYSSGQKDISIYKKNSVNPAISISVSDLIMTVGSTQNITVTTKNFTATPTITFSVTDSTVVSVVKDGDAYKVTGLVKGTTTVKFTATSGTETAEATCTVSLYLNNAKCLSVAEALEICSIFGTTGTEVEYTVRGYVSEIKYAFTEANGSSFNLVDNIGDSSFIYVYKLNGGEEIKVGDYLYITGKLKIFGSNNEIETPQTYVNVSNKLNSCESYFSLAYQYDNNEGALSNSEFRFRLGVTNELASVLTNVKADSKEYGLKVSTGDKTVYYAFNDETLTDESVLYMILSLGDIINDKTKLSAEFTVCAYAKVDGVTVESTSTKTYSVKTLVNYYYSQNNTKDLVESLYNVLNQPAGNN